MSASKEVARRVAEMYKDELRRALQTYHPLKGATFARDWLAEALETHDDAWRYECLREAHKAVSWLRRA